MGAAKGSRNAAIWTEEEMREKFEAAYIYALEDPDALCVQDLFIHMGISRKYFYKLIERYPEYEEMHDKMKDALIAKVNRGAIKGDYSSTPCIWRMKQLGEKDTSEVHQHVTGTTTQKRIIIKDFGEDA